MAQKSSNSLFALVILIAIFLQVVFVFADGRETATGAAVEFSKAYFMLDSKMADRVCGDLAGDEEETAVGAFIQKAADEASDRGVGVGYIRHTLYGIKTETISQDAETAKIKLMGKTRVCINPLYAFVAKIFFLGDTYKVEEVLDLVKEDGKWKVCGAPYSLQTDV